MSRLRVSLPSDDPMEQLVTFGKHQGATWLQVLDADPRYVRWALGNLNLGAELHSALEDAYDDAYPLDYHKADSDWGFFR